jgi:L-ascorbate metabolism protein UlaG (beta-lactamase superfamily)
MTGPPRVWGRLRGPDGGIAGPRVADTARWVFDLMRGARQWPPLLEPAPRVAPSLPDGDAAVWVGHATVLARISGVNVLFDPVFGEVGLIPRVTPAAWTAETSPRIDVVALSHDHRDHLDRPSIVAVEARHRPQWAVMSGLERLLVRWGVDANRITPLRWWTNATYGPVTLHAVPANHWSHRAAWDRNTRLWGGFVASSDRASVYFAGDTAWFDGFRDIGVRFPGIDLAFLPIGAYEPEWFLTRQHLNPEQAGAAFEALGARRLVAMHWGTFALGDEPIPEPPRRLRAWADARGVSDRVEIPPIGGTVLLADARRSPQPEEAPRCGTESA